MNFLNIICQLPPAASVPSRLNFKVRAKLKISNRNKIATIILTARDLM